MNGHAERTRVEGSGSQFFRSQRDFKDESVFPKAEFFEPNLIDVMPEVFKSPPIAETMVRDLQAHRLLVFGGHELREKPLFARHVAWLLRQELCARDKVEEKEISILQWHPSSVPPHLDDAFSRPEKVTIFLFPAIQPYHLGYDLRHFLDAVVGHEHYAIIATDSVRAQWTLEDDWVEAGIWRECATADLFDSEYLTEVLHYRLEDVQGLLSEPFLPDGLPDNPDGDTVLIQGLSIGEAAAGLGTPNRIRSFVATLCGEDAAASEEWVREKLDQLGGSSHSVHRWFRQSDQRDQLLALGLALFDGLFDDQVFAGLEVLVKSAWRAWDPMLSHFDYHELEKAGAYFSGTDADTKTTRIECSSAADRKALFEVGWKLHRRRILATLPLMVEMVGDSTYGPSRNNGDDDRQVLEKLEQSSQTNEAEQKPAEDGTGSEERSLSEDETRHSRWHRHGAWRDLFGSAGRNAQFRRVAAQTLSQLGLFSQDAVERTLLDLAEDGRPEVQAVAASAIASWREALPVEENSRKLFRLLAAWQSEARQKEHAQRRRRHGVVEPLAHIRATVALTVSYASLHDRPNDLAEPLYKRVEKFIDDRSPILRRRFAGHTLPVVVAGHLDQMKKLLWDKVLLEPDLLYAAASGMALAYLLRPQEAQPILDGWCDQARALPEQDLPKGELTRRETALATVAMTYGRIPPGEGREALAPHQIFRRLQTLGNEDHPFVRGAVLLAMIVQARYDLEQAAPEMQPLISEVTLEERGFVIERLTELYLEQRREQPDGEDRLVVRGLHYPTWIKEKRPPTAIENVLYEWVQDSSYPVAQQLAFETLVAFAETPLGREEQRREEERRNRIADPDEDAEIDVIEPRQRKKRLRHIPVFGRVAVFLAAFAAPEMRMILPPLLPEYLRRQRTSLPRRLFELVRHAAKKGKAGWQELLEIETLKKAFYDPDTSASSGLRILEQDNENGDELVRYLHRAANIYHWRWVVSGFGMIVFILSALAFYVMTG